VLHQAAHLLAAVCRWCHSDPVRPRKQSLLYSAATHGHSTYVRAQCLVVQQYARAPAGAGPAQVSRGCLHAFSAGVLAFSAHTSGTESQLWRTSLAAAAAGQVARARAQASSNAVLQSVRTMQVPARRFCGHLAVRCRAVGVVIRFCVIDRPLGTFQTSLHAGRGQVGLYENVECVFGLLRRGRPLPPAGSDSQTSVACTPPSPSACYPTCAASLTCWLA